MNLPRIPHRPLALALCLALASLAACAGPEPANEAAAQPAFDAPAAEISSPNATGAPTAAAADGLPQAVYASQTQLVELYKGQITIDNLDALLDEIEAEIATDSAEDPD